MNSWMRRCNMWPLSSQASAARRKRLPLLLADLRTLPLLAFAITVCVGGGAGSSLVVLCCRAVLLCCSCLVISCLVEYWLALPWLVVSQLCFIFGFLIYLNLSCLALPCLAPPTSFFSEHPTPQGPKHEEARPSASVALQAKFLMEEHSADIAGIPEPNAWGTMLPPIQLPRKLRLALPCVGIDGCGPALQAMQVRVTSCNVFDLEQGYETFLKNTFLRAAATRQCRLARKPETLPRFRLRS